MLFMITVILNMLIGLFQEIRSKHMLDKLSLLNQSKIHILKDNQEVEVYIQDVEEKDILVLHAGMKYVVMVIFCLETLNVMNRC